MSLTLRDLQLKLQKKGYYTGVVDGLYGPLTRKAIEAWGPSGTDLDAPQRPPEPGTVIPPMWLVSCHMSRVIVHWTAGGPHCSGVDEDHYHIIVDQELKLHRGNHSISDNVNTADGDYAAHTLNCNGGSIGIAMTGMLDAVERPFNPGPYPIKLAQWQLTARAVAEIITFYGIPLNAMSVLQHGEVEKTLHIKQRGKWDCMVLPWDPTAPAANAFRAEVLKHLAR